MMTGQQRLGSVDGDVGFPGIRDDRVAHRGVIDPGVSPCCQRRGLSGPSIDEVHTGRCGVEGYHPVDAGFRAGCAPLLDKTRWLPRLVRPGRLTPGDFATLVRRQRLAAGPLTAANLFEGLRREADFKAGREGRGIGFAADF